MRYISALIVTLTMLLGASANAKTLDVDQYLDLVARHSKDLKLAQQELELASATKKEAVSGALPHVSATAGYNRNLKDTYMYIDLGEMQKLKVNRNNEYSAVVRVKQPLFNGTVFNAIRAAKEYEKLSDFIYEASNQHIFTVAKQSFYQALLLKIVWEVAQLSEQNGYENYMNVKLAFDNGLASEFELLQSEVRYRDAIPQTTEAERNYRIALIDLKNLAGIPAGEEISLDGTLEEYPDLPAEEVVSSILEKRPDYKALLWEEKLRTTGVRAERAGYMPSLDGTFTYAFSSQSDEWSFDERNNSYTVGLSLSVPIFTGGATRSKVQQAKIELNKTRINIDKAQDNIEREVRNTRLRLDEAHNRIVSARSVLRAAEKAFAIAETTSQSGLTTQLELKDSRVALDQATVGYYSAIFEYLVAYFDWDRVIGEVSPDGV